MAKLAKNEKYEKYIVDMYVRYFGRAADADTIDAYAEDKKTSIILKNIIADADAEKAELSTSDFVNNAFQNLFGRNATTKEMNKYSKVIEKGKNLPINSIVKSASKTDKAVYDNKIAVAVKYAELGGKGDLDLSKISKGNLIDIKFVNTVTKAADLKDKVAALPDNSGIPNSFDGKTFVLTTSVNTGKDFVGTAKNDEFIASKGTWGAGDKIDGGKGTDGLTIVTNDVDDLDFSVNTMKSIEIVNITSSDNATVKIDAVTAGKVADNFKDVTDLYLTTSDNAGIIDATVNGTTNVTATAKGTAAVNVTGGKVVNATATTGKVTIKGDALTTVTVKGGTGNDIDNLGTDTPATSGAGETLKSVTFEANAAGTNTIKGNAIDTLTLKDQTAAAGLTTTITNTKSTALTVNLNNVNTGASVVNAGAKAETITINSNGTKDNTLEFNAAAGKTLNITGDAKLTLVDASNAKDVVSTNTKGVTITGTLGNDVKFTGGTGADSVTLTAGYTKAINMGAGDDTVVYFAAGAGGSLNGGDGNDTLVVSASSAIAGLPEVSGFEVLRAKGGTNTTHNANTFKALEVGANTTTTTFTNVAAGVGLTVLEANVGNTTTVTLANATGNADVFDLTLKSDATINAGTVALAGVETININSVDTNTIAGANTNTLVLTAADATSVVVTGDAKVAVTATGSTKIATFDASATKEGVEFTADTGSISNITITGGAGNDKLTGGTLSDTINGGAGDDTLVYTGGADTFTGGAGNDTFKIEADGTKTKYLTITDLTKGDIINLNSVTNDSGVASTFVTAKVTLLPAATFDEYLNKAAEATTGGTDSIAKWFQFEGNTYLVNDNSNNATFTEGTDTIVKITGLVDLSNSTYVAGTDTLTIA